MPRAWLIRHPALAGSEGYAYGRYDWPLLPQALDALRAELTAQLPNDLLWISSPAERCRQVWTVLAPALRGESLAIDARWHELDMGLWEGCRWQDIDRAEIDQWAANPLDWVLPGGESVRQMQQRVLQAWHECCAHGQDCAIITHGGPLRCLLAHWSGHDDPTRLRAPPMGTILTVDLSDTPGAPATQQQGIAEHRHAAESHGRTRQHRA
jgi:alpha-ribazole phosphatase